MATGTTRYVADNETQPACGDAVGVQPLSRGVALLTIVGISAGLWYGIYRLAAWLL